MNIFILFGGWYLIGFLSLLFAVGPRTLMEKQSRPYIFWGSFFGPVVTLVIVAEALMKDDTPL